MVNVQRERETERGRVMRETEMRKKRWCWRRERGLKVGIQSKREGNFWALFIEKQNATSF